MWFSATVVQETCCAIETGKPLCPSDRQVLIAQSLPCLLAILAAICRRAAMQPMLEPLVELMYGTPGAIAKAPRARGSCVFFFLVCGVLWCGGCVSSDTVAHCPHRLRAAVVVIVVGVVVVGVVAAGKTQHHDLGRKGEGTHQSCHAALSLLLLLPDIPQEQNQPPFNRTVAKSDGHTAVTSTAVEYYCTLVQSTVRDDMAGCTAGRPAQQAAPHAHARAHAKAAWLVTVVIGWADPLCWDGQLPVQSSPVQSEQ